VNRSRYSTLVRAFAALGIVLALIALAGCSKSQDTSSNSVKPKGMTAKQASEVAVKALATTAPDAKLLVAETAQPVSPTSTPIWEFLYGNPKTDVLYAIIVDNGKAQKQEYGKGGLSASEWAAVPNLSNWKVDSDAAYNAALKVYPNGTKAQYIPGFVTYIPKRAGNTATKPMTWVFVFDERSKGNAATSTVNVDMATGSASLAK
jgi:hypothetical protein